MKIIDQFLIVIYHPQKKKFMKTFPSEFIVEVNIIFLILYDDFKKKNTEKGIFLNVTFDILIFEIGILIFFFTIILYFFSIQSIKYISNSSISFYIIVGVNQSLSPDLRGNFWEFQFRNHFINYSLNYISDSNMTINNKKFINLYSNYTYLRDPQLCLRTSGTWDHFITNFNKSLWYFRGTHDTFINLTNLFKLIKKIEKKKDPLKEDIFYYNLHEYKDRFYPHGGTGWLFSNHAVQTLQNNRNIFLKFCKNSFDDVSLTYLFNYLNKNVYDWYNPNFFVTWPKEQNYLIKNQNFQKIPNCNKN